MSIVLSHETALDFWRLFDYAHYPDLRISRIRSLATARSTLCDLKEAKPFASLVGNLYTHGDLDVFDRMGLSTRPLHVLVSNICQQRSTPLVIAHGCTQALPPRSLVEIGPNVFVVSPELCLVQVASAHHVEDVIALGYELCSNYRLPPSLVGDFISAKPVMTASSLQEYLGRLARCPGKKIATSAAQHVIDNSRSPAETQMAIALTLPGKMGGYGLPKPMLNQRVPIPQGLLKYTTRRSIECDLFWPEYRIDLEYNSTLHDNEIHRGYDNNRPVVFEKLGITHIAVSRWQSNSREQFEIVVRMLRDHMGLRKREYRPDQELRHLNLRLYLNDRHL